MSKTIIPVMVSIALALYPLEKASATGSCHENDSAHSVTAYPYRKQMTGVSDIDSLIMLQRFKTVRSEAQALITKARRKKQSTEAYDKAVRLCAQGERGLRGVDRVVVLDSVVMAKKNFLSAYLLSDDMGSLHPSRNGDRTFYYTQLNGIVFGADKDSSDSTSTHMQLNRYYLNNEKLTDPQPITGLGLDGCDLNYPFMMPDGQVFYFAARSDEGYGNYDLYVTRYDSESKQFYQAENMGYPYNSPANDYMLVINENANIGWFASDRYQPADSVCIYTFVPNESRHTIDYETAESSVLHAFASLSSIATLPYTAEEQQIMQDGLMRLNKLRRQATDATHHAFHFVLNDKKDCYNLSDFSSPQAQELCQQWVQKSRNLQNLKSQLEQLRDSSLDAAQQILNLERRVSELKHETHELEKAVRRAELEK